MNTKTQVEKRVTAEDVDVLGDGLGFRLAWTVHDYSAQVTAYEIVARAADGGAPEFHVGGSMDMSDWTQDLDAAEPYLEGYVKWDGCTELNQGQPHWCGPAGYAKHILLLQHIYRRAFELMGRDAEEAWPLTIAVNPK